MLVALTITGCSLLLPNEGLQPGWRRFIILVANDSPRPATLVVADDTSVAVRPVGRVSPGTVPPMTAMDVTFDVPPGRSWMIVVNPGPDHGGLIGASDVPPSAIGRLPLKIHIETGPGTEGGSVEVPSLPGWFGN
jgi:hypothetical protein